MQEGLIRKTFWENRPKTKGMKAPAIAESPNPLVAGMFKASRTLPIRRSHSTEANASDSPIVAAMKQSHVKHHTKRTDSETNWMLNSRR